MKKNQPYLFFLWSIFFSPFSSLFAQNTSLENLNLMPVPAKVQIQNGKFRLQKDFSYALSGKFDQRLSNYTLRFLRRLDQRTGLFFKQDFVDTNIQPNAPKLLINSQLIAKITLHEDESYTLNVNPNNIEIKSQTDVGAMRALETLLQLLKSDAEGYYFPTVNIQDTPRFPWRGLMIDVARHFQPMEVIKRNIDGMAAVKLNVLHLHITDNQGFRIESKTYPKLHELGSDGQYFTQAEIKEIVQYAGDRGIRVMPEFDLPPHATAWLVGYPEYASKKGTKYTLERKAGIFDPVLDPTQEETYTFLEKFFQEILPLFPDAYVHIGGDENEEGRDWKQNPDIQAFMKKNQIADNHALQAYFNQKVLKIFDKLGKTMIGWEEILHPNVPKTAVIHSWFGKESLFRAAKNGYQTILSKGFYIDLMHPAEDHYLNDPLLPEGRDLSEVEKKRILGGEATMWSELVTPLTIDSRIWPRMAAIAERLWSPAEVNNVKDMYRRLDIISQQLELLGLQHIAYQDIILRNLAGNGSDLKPLKTLVDVIEPMKVYNRNPNGDLYTMLSPFTLIADAANVDAPAANRFKNEMEVFLYQKTSTSKEFIEKQMRIWQENHSQLQKIIAQSPVLKEIESLSENLSKIATIGLEALEKGESADYQWYLQALKTLESARKQGGRTELQVVDPIEKLVKTLCGQIQAQFTTQAPKIDGDLSDWKSSDWQKFSPSKWYFWKDTCSFALKWDEKNLYIAFKVTNSKLQARLKQRDAKGLHEDDGVEFLLDTDFDRANEWKNDDIAYHINVLNGIIDDKGSLANGEYNNTWNGKAQTAVKLLGTVNNPQDKDQGYQVEVAISWQELGKKPSSDLKMGINLCINDRDDASQSYRYFDYMKLKVFHFPIGFTRLNLVK